MRRTTSRQFPAAPADWDASSKAVWDSLIRTLENSDLFDRGRRTRPAFIVKTTVSAPVTLDVSAPDLTVLTQVVGKLLISLANSNFVDVREDL